MTEVKTYNTYVSFLDILGFKELINNSEDTKALLSIFDELFLIITSALRLDPLKFNEKYKTDIRIHDTFIINSKNPEPELLSDEQNINFITISDSIIIWGENDSIYSFQSVFSATQQILNKSFRAGMPLRGSIAFGDIILLDNGIKTNKVNSASSLFGRPIVEAYEDANKQRWSGCTITESCFKKVEDSIAIMPGSFSKELYSNSVYNNCILYDIPYRDSDKKGRVLNWVKDFPGFGLIQLEIVDSCFQAKGKKKQDGDVRTIVLNTKRFIFDIHEYYKKKQEACIKERQAENNEQ